MRARRTVADRFATIASLSFLHGLGGALAVLVLGCHGAIEGPRGDSPTDAQAPPAAPALNPVVPGTTPPVDSGNPALADVDLSSNEAAYCGRDRGIPELQQQPADPRSARDVDVAVLSRSPELAYDAAVNVPAPGSVVTWQVSLRNRGSAPTGAFELAWSVGDAPVKTVQVAAIAPGATAFEKLTVVEPPCAYQVSVLADSGAAVAELSERNNALSTRSDALMVGLWVEQSFYNHVDRTAAEFATANGFQDEARSFEDWANRHMRRWNELLAQAVFPSTPAGGLDRVRLQKVVVVPDGGLPVGGGGGNPGPRPNIHDKTVDMMWGFPASQVGQPNWDASNSASELGLSWGFVHELNHARFILDTYFLNTQGREVDVLDPAGQRLFAATDAIVRRASTGRSLMSFNGEWRYAEWEIRWLNEYARQRRPLSDWGNYNCHAGCMRYLQRQDVVPSRNVLQILDASGRPLVGAQVALFKSSASPTNARGKLIDNTPEATFTTDARGEVDLGAAPLSATAWEFDTLSRAVSLVMIRDGAAWDITWLDLAELQVQSFRGNAQRATFQVPTRISP